MEISKFLKFYFSFYQQVSNTTVAAGPLGQVSSRGSGPQTIPVGLEERETFFVCGEGADAQHCKEGNMKLRVNVSEVCYFAVREEHLVATIPSWGPAYRVSFDLYIRSFDTTSGDWGEILRFTNTENSAGNVGDREPAVFGHTDGKIHINAVVGKATDIYLNETTWHTIEIVQQLRNRKVVKTSLPYFGVKLSCVCLMFACRGK